MNQGSLGLVVPDLLVAAGLAFVLVGLAELGDKTQLALLTLAARGGGLGVWAGATVAFLVLTAVAVVAGGLVARAVPRMPLLLVAGALFVGLGVWMWWQAGPEDDAVAVPSRRAAFLSAWAVTFVAELGDRTQIVTAALAAQGDSPFGTFLGAFVALAVVSALAVGGGRWLAARIPVRLVQRIGAVLLVVVGVATLVLAFV